MTDDRRRAICLVLDGCGVGAMDGAETPNTLASIERVSGAPGIPTLNRLGFDAVAAMAGSDASLVEGTGGAGRSRTSYAGADTYLGHQELMGTIPACPVRSTLDELGDAFVDDLRQEGLDARWQPAAGSRVVVVGDAVVHDNIEAARGVNINVTASLDELDFDAVLHIAEKVRAVTKVGRVIAVGGRGFDRDDILRGVRRHEQGHIGVDTPTLGVYDEHYRVRHLGYAVSTHRQVPSLAKRAGLSVALLGKAADVVWCPNPDVCDPVIETDGVFDRALQAMAGFERGLIVLNIQETDLAGHEQDAQRYRAVLEDVDRRLAGFLDVMGDNDLLIISADHGNDPASGSSQHTREFVPLLVHGPRAVVGTIGTRDTLADVGATLAAWLQLPPTGDGRPVPAEPRG